MRTALRNHRRTGGIALAMVTALALLGIAALTVTGCSSSSGGSDPEVVTGISMTVSRDQAQPGQAVTVRANAAYRGDRAVDVDWYVDGIAGGDSAVGTITSANPATYTAPLEIPDAASVTIEARYDTLITASEVLPLVHTIFHVNAASGDNDTGSGIFSNPYKTITRALAVVDQGDTVYVHPGTYDEALGENFSLTIPLDSTLRGAAAESCLIVVGETSYGVWANNGATFEHFTLDIEAGATPSRGVGTTNTATIRDIHTNARFTNSVLYFRFPENASLIEDCSLINTTGVVDDRGIEIVDDAHVTLRNTIVDGYSLGVFVNTESDPLIEGCTFRNCTRGVIVYQESTLPDLGGGARGSMGGNTFLDNDDGLYHQGELTVYAIGNTWGSDPPVVGTMGDIGNDITVTGVGTVIYE